MINDDVWHAVSVFKKNEYNIPISELFLYCKIWYLLIWIVSFLR